MNIFSNNEVVYADDTQESIEEELVNQTNQVFEDVDFSYLNELLDQIKYDFEIFDGKSFKEYVASVIAGDETIDISTFFKLFLSSFKNGIKSILAPLVSILIVVLLCSMFGNIRSSKFDGVGEVIYFICFSIVVIIVVAISSKLISDTKDSLISLQRQMAAIFPILISLMSLIGGVVSVKAYSPMLAFLSNAISNIFIYVLLPLFSFSLILSFIGNLSANAKLGKLNGFISSLFKWIIGSTFAIFITFLSIKGITAGGSDGISIKATKFAIKNYVPFLGGYISDGFELVKAGGLIVKNATGFAGIVLLLITISVPVIAIATLQLGLKLLAGVIEPIGDSRCANLLYDISKSFKLLVAIIVGIGLMYFLTMFLMICSLANFL